MSTGSFLRNSPLWLNVLVLIVILALGSIFIWIIFPPGGPRGVAAVTTRGGRMLALRLPSSDLNPQKQIVVFDDKPLPKPRIVIFEPASPQAGDQYEEIQLTVEQWTAINNIRKEWCENAPMFPSPSGNMFYDIGIHCENRVLQSARRIVIPVDYLPPDLQELVNLFVPPTN